MILGAILIFNSYFSNLMLTLTGGLFTTDLYYISSIHSLIHSSIITLGALTYIYFPIDYTLIFLKYYSVGHLLNDSIYYHYLKDVTNSKNLYLIHHSIFIIGWFIYDNYDKYLFCRVLLAEMSVITFNLRYIFKYNNLGYVSLFSYLTFFLFFIVRIVNFTDIIFIMKEKKYYNLQIIFLPLLGLQYYWFSLMCKKFYKIVIGIDNEASDN
jgi:hypothetical protein